MFGTLLESRARRRRRPGGAAVSIAMHMAIIGALRPAQFTERPYRRRNRGRFCCVSRTRRHRRRGRSTTRRFETSCSAQSSPLRFRFIASIRRRPSSTTCRRSTRRLAVGSTASSSVTAVRGCARRRRGASRTSRGMGRRDLQTRILASGKLRYPESLRQAAIDGRVLVRFTVDTTGRIDMSSVSVLASTHDCSHARCAMRCPRFCSSRPNWADIACARSPRCRSSFRSPSNANDRGPRATSRRACEPS